MVHTCIYFKNITENQENYKNWFSEAEFPFSIPYNLPYLVPLQGGNVLHAQVVPCALLTSKLKCSHEKACSLLSETPTIRKLLVGIKF